MSEIRRVAEGRGKLDLKKFLPYRLNRLASEMSARTRKTYTPMYDLTLPEWRVVATLAEKCPLTAKVIGAETYMHKTKVSRAVDALTARRWVKREVNEKDHREEFLSLTKPGWAAYRKLEERLTNFQNGIFEKAGDKTKTIFEALEILEEILGIADQPPA